MRMNPRRGSILILVAVIAALAGTSSAQTPSSADLTSSDRLFLGFAEDAAIIQRQWWEGMLEVDNSDSVDATILRGIVAFQPWNDVELGGTMGFGDTDAPGGFDGSGGTDLDLWGKYMLGSDANQTDFVVGAGVTVPTGDDSAGLGTDSFGAGVFGAFRYKLPNWVLSAHAGLRMNGDGQVANVDIDGQTSVQLGGGALIPLNDRLTAVGEVWYEGARFEDFDADLRVLGGVNWHVTERGTLRGAVSFGLDDGAPDQQLLVSFAGRF
jgi:hypothetical protein